MMRMALMAKALMSSVIIMVALLCATIASAQVLPFTYLTTDREVNPLPSAEVHRVHQDASGLIWMAVYSSGLAAYDGTGLDLGTTEQGLRDLLLWDIVEDANGHLWVASNAGIVVSERSPQELGPGDTLRFLSSVGDIPLLDVAVRMNNLTAAVDGSVWIGTGSDGLVRYHLSQDAHLQTDTLLFGDAEGGPVSIQAVYARSDGSIWVSLSDRRLVVLDGDGSQRRAYSTADGLPEVNINVLYEDNLGRLYAGTADGSVLAITNGRALGVETVVSALGSNVSSILRDATGVLWIATQGSGLLRRSGDETHLLTRVNGLLSETIHHVMEDREGNLWISQTGGVARLRAGYRAFEAYTSRSYRGEAPVLPAGAINAVLPLVGADCRILAATAEAGIACISDDGTSTTVSEREGIQNNWVNALALDGDGDVWVGTLRGVSRIAGQSLRDRSVAPQVENFGGASVMAARVLHHPDATGRTLTSEIVWLPAYQSLYAHHAGSWYIFRDLSGLPPTVFQSVELAPDGHLLVGSRDRGLFRSVRPMTLDMLDNAEVTRAPLSRSGAGASGSEVTDTTFEALDLDDRLPSLQIDYILAIDDHLWIATPGGLTVLDGDTFELVDVFDRQSGLPADNVISLAYVAGQGMLWAGTNRGLVGIDVRERRVRRVVTQQDGLVNNEVWFLGSVAADADGSILYGTGSGLSRYRPDLDVPSEAPPAVRIRSAVVSAASGRSNEAAFEFAGLTFADEKRTIYRTRLAGYERDWSAPTTQSRLRYTNLPAWFVPRTYTLQVLAAGPTGVWSTTPAEFSFDVAPPWWLTWWAFGVYALLLAVGVIAAHTVQHGRVVRRERDRAQLREAELRAETAQARTEAAEAESRALMAENDRKASELQKARELERAYYDLKAAQTRLVQAEKMASLGRLAAGIAHEIKNPLNFVNNFAALSEELVIELREALGALNGEAGDDAREEIEAILDDLELNAQKIREHGKRTDGIVRSMLMHSRGTDSEAVPVHVNELVSEYLNLAYHGMRAQHPDFNTAIERDFDPADAEAVVAPQELGRVIINLLNNAFYAVHEKQRVTPGFQPEIRVRTLATDSGVEIRVRDNGPGIPTHIRERIFEPFFTTKPTGAGTGLGLSLSYDIVTQGHGGKLSVESRQGDFTEFTIELPHVAGRPGSTRPTSASVTDNDMSVP